ncbi:MAG: PQQ-like beta-propeller repeat protein [Armatimonadetes bacterium]|nr:PQQ-like beta-propeller repeat protein [Armatimonadota bacterium]
MIWLLIAADSSSVHPPMPPYRREATVPVFSISYNPQTIVAGNVLIATSGVQCNAFSLPTMTRLWSAKIPNGELGEHLLLAKDKVLVSTSTFRKPSHLYALDLKTGKIAWQMGSITSNSAIALAGNTLYVSLKPTTVSAVDLRTRKARWTSTPWKADKQSLDDKTPKAIAASPTGLAVHTGHSVVGLNPKTGKQVWIQEQSYMFKGTLPTVAGVVWIETNLGSVGRSLQTGKVLWTLPKFGYGEYGGVTSGLFLGLDHGYVAEVDAKTGKVIWSKETGSHNMSGGYQYGSILGQTTFIVGENTAYICDLKGKVAFQGGPASMPPQPVWTDGKSLVCFDGTRLLRYVHGEETPIPTDSKGRQALAEQMVARFDDLDSAGKTRLMSLGDDAFPPVLHRLMKVCDEYDVAEKNQKIDSYALYSKYHDLADLLEKVTGKNRTNDLLDALKNASKESSAKPFLLGLLAQHGDPEVITPFFLNELEGVKTPGFELYESATYVARSYIIQSKDPRAIAFMLKALRDPKADGELRIQAYWHLAGTGGEEGLQEVLKQRHHRELLRPIGERVLTGYLGAGEFGTTTKPEAEKKDASGRTWGLLTSGVLGSAGDLWLAEKVNGKWTNPLFTGVSLDGISRWVKNPPAEPKIAGKTAKELVKTDWVKLLVGNPELSKDSDHDGLTDLEEKRLGTDPHKADTDGDGDLDGVDPWPNVAKRTLTEDEKVLAAAFEARYHDSDSEGPALFYGPKGMKPFEMPGRRGTVMWAPENNERWTLPLEMCYEQGIGLINVSPIQWNADKTIATVEISTAYGGLNGTGYQGVVKKFGDEWVVVEMGQTWVS